MKFQVVSFTVLLIIASLSKAQADNRLGVYCGRVLADKMALICDWGEYEEDKRSGRNEMKNGPNELGWFGPRTYHAYSGVKSKRGIVEDCCYQPCDISTLLSYC